MGALAMLPDPPKSAALQVDSYGVFPIERLQPILKGCKAAHLRFQWLDDPAFYVRCSTLRAALSLPRQRKPRRAWIDLQRGRLILRSDTGMFLLWVIKSCMTLEQQSDLDYHSLPVSIVKV